MDISDSSKELFPREGRQSAKVTVTVKAEATTRILNLHKRTIAYGHLMMGAVHCHLKDHILLNLPYGMKGEVWYLPNGYVTLNHSTSNISKQMNLEEILPVGMRVPCSVIDKPPERSGRHIKCSLNPRDFNIPLTDKPLQMNMVLYGAVHSIGSGRCLIDLGMPNVTVYMTTNSSSTALSVGMIRRFRCIQVSNMGADKKQTGMVKLMDSSKTEVPISHYNLDLNLMLPGTLVKGKIARRMSVGLIVELGPLRGCIHKTHLHQSVEDYRLNQEVVARALTVHPEGSIQLSMNTSLVEHIDEVVSPFTNNGMGQNVEMSVLSRDRNYVYYSLPDYPRCYCPVYSRLPAHIGSTLIGHWNAFDYLEQQPVITLNPQIESLDTPVTYKCGDKLTVRIGSFHLFYCFCETDDGIQCRIALSHLADVPPTDPKSEFRVGQFLVCRVLNVDRTTNRLLLTAKPSLVSSSKPPICEHSQLKHGNIVTGVIHSVSAAGLSVKFYNNVTVTVPRALMAVKGKAADSDEFYQGQVVDCFVIRNNTERPVLSLYHEPHQIRALSYGWKKAMEEGAASLTPSLPNYPSPVPSRNDINDDLLPKLLTKKNLEQGHRVLAAVQSCEQYQIILNLPNNLLGVVQLANLPKGCVRLLSEYAHSHDDNILSEPLLSLCTIFPLGSRLPCAVLDVAVTKEGNMVQCSLNPAAFNADFKKELLSSTPLWGAVHSVEDHGYVIDLGLPQLTAFLKDETQCIGLKVGMIRRFQCSAIHPRSRSDGKVVVNVELYELSHQAEQKTARSLADKNIPFTKLLPGALVRVVVEESSSVGLRVKLGEHKGFVHHTHLPVGRSHLDYHSKQKMYARVLAIHSSSMLIHLTLNQSLLKSVQTIESPPNLPVATQLVPYSIVRVHANLKSISWNGFDSYVLKSDKLDYWEGRKNGFYNGYDYLENRPIINDTRAVELDGDIRKYDGGERVRATVTEVTAEGYHCTVNGDVPAFIPSTELDQQYRNERFDLENTKTGSVISCKVRRVDTILSVLILTARKILVLDRSCPIRLESDFKPKLVVTGVICEITVGVFVEFYNGIKGFVGPKELGIGDDNSAKDCFYVGEIVKCMVLNSNGSGTLLTFKLDQYAEGPSVKKSDSEKLESMAPLVSNGKALRKTFLQNRVLSGAKRCQTVADIKVGKVYPVRLLNNARRMKRRLEVKFNGNLYGTVEKKSKTGGSHYNHPWLDFKPLLAKVLSKNGKAITVSVDEKDCPRSDQAELCQGILEEYLHHKGMWHRLYANDLKPKAGQIVEGLLTEVRAVEPDPAHEGVLAKDISLQLKNDECLSARLLMYEETNNGNVLSDQGSGVEVGGRLEVMAVFSDVASSAVALIYSEKCVAARRAFLSQKSLPKVVPGDVLIAVPIFNCHDYSLLMIETEDKLTGQLAYLRDVSHPNIIQPIPMKIWKPQNVRVTHALPVGELIVKKVEENIRE